jgi:2-keto-4-pentenoate hydratase/2-oxohepta-3-ene-1,7-dioic acid hydratase in catechol pathway
MKLYLGLLENRAPRQTKIFGEVEGRLIDLSLVYASYLAQVQGAKARAYDFAAFYFPATISEFLERGESSLTALGQISTFIRQLGVGSIHGPTREKIVYEAGEVRILPPLKNNGKTIVIGFSDQARIEVIPNSAIPTGFLKLPSTIVASGDAIVCPKFSEEIDCDACCAIVIGKAARRIEPETAWDHVAGFTLLLDITARDINKREGLTKNNLLGKNFPSSTSLGPALVLESSRGDLDRLDISLEVNGLVQQRFAPRECIFSVEELVARWSLVGLNPGDILAMGGSMVRRDDGLLAPVPLTRGSRVRCASPTIGELSHDVI